MPLKSKLVRFCVLLCFLAALFAAQPLVSPELASAAQPSAKEAVSTKITADSMRYDPSDRKITFFKNVVVTHPDFTMFSEKMELYLSDVEGAAPANADSAKNSGVDSGRVEKVISYVKVKILLPEGRVGTCDKAVYTVKNEILRMEGTEKNPAVLTESSNKLSGDVVLFYLNENRSEAHGNVQADISSK
jgi:lipopolysaccharide export system protein LptA